MHLNRGIKIQLAIFSVVSLIAALIMVFVYIKLPVLLFGVGRCTSTADIDYVVGELEAIEVARS